MTAGRPQKLTFDEQILTVIRNLTKKGKTQDEISEILGISRTTFYRYKQISEEFSDAINSNRDIADDMVERALFEAATGYVAPETKVFMTKGGDIVTHDMEKHYPPDTKAAQFWLRNRRAKNWVDKVDVNQTSEIKIEIDKDDAEL